MGERPVRHQSDAIVGTHRPSAELPGQSGGGRPAEWHARSSDQNAQWLYLPFSGTGVLLLVLRGAFDRRERLVLRQRDLPSGRWAALPIEHPGMGSRARGGCPHPDSSRDTILLRTPLLSSVLVSANPAPA